MSDQHATNEERKIDTESGRVRETATRHAKKQQKSRETKNVKNATEKTQRKRKQKKEDQDEEVEERGASEVHKWIL